MHPYGVHPDGKSHTGSSITVGEAVPVDSWSKKHSIVAKSSTEAELISASDSTGRGISLLRFLRAQGCDVSPCLTFYQDNLSTKTLIEKGKSTSARTKHVNILRAIVNETFCPSFNVFT